MPMSDITLSKKQILIVEKLIDWFKASSQKYITLGGYAGTGKTTLLGYLSKKLHNEKKNIKIAFCSYTGKASRVLERKLRDVKSLDSDDFIGTIHRLIYRPIVDERDEIIGWEKVPTADFKYSLIVIDEASMVTEDIWNDLLSFGIPILAVGDHGQLPPINSEFNLMKKPELKLEDIYRQEASNPIIKISEMARREGRIPFDIFGKNIKKIHKEDEDTQEILTDIFESFDENTMVLCGYNSSRIKLNKGIRALHFDKEIPQVGDRVICLKNNRIENIFNGMMGNILDISKEKTHGFSYYETEIALDCEDYTFWGKISINQFNSPTLIDLKMREVNYFDFGYALTVHKAQGSQAKRVVVFEERFSKMDDESFARWLYTAVTRAEKELIIVA